MRFRRLEHAVNEAARQWGATFDAISDAVVLVDGAGVIQRANRSFERLGGESPAGRGPPRARSSSPGCPGRTGCSPPRPRAPSTSRWAGACCATRPTCSGRGRRQGEAARVITMSDVTALRAAELERAGALEREREISRILQESLLPEHLPARRAHELDAWHVAAEQELIVGGDWYDAIETTAGPVAGHRRRRRPRRDRHRPGGPAAPHAAGSTPTRASSADEAMVALNELVASSAAWPRCSWPSSRPERARSASSTPVIRRPSCSASGAPSSSRRTAVPRSASPPRLHRPDRAAGPGERLLIYTDGLVERPREHLDIGLERLRAAAEDTQGWPICASGWSAAHRPGGPARRRGPAPGPGVMTGARGIRRRPADQLTSAGRVDPVELAVEGDHLARRAGPGVGPRRAQAARGLPAATRQASRTAEIPDESMKLTSRRSSDLVAAGRAQRPGELGRAAQIELAARREHDASPLRPTRSSKSASSTIPVHQTSPVSAPLEASYPATPRPAGRRPPRRRGLRPRAAASAAPARRHPLAVSEAATNAVVHAYRGREGDIRAQVTRHSRRAPRRHRRPRPGHGARAPTAPAWGSGCP